MIIIDALNSLISELNRTIDDCVKFGRNNAFLVGGIVFAIYLFQDFGTLVKD